MWGIEAIDLLGPAFTRSSAEEGEMRFIAHARLDVRYDARSGGPVAEFPGKALRRRRPTLGPRLGRVGTAGRLVGHFHIHGGDDSGLRL